MLIDYLDYFPIVAAMNLGRSAVVIGRTTAGAGLTLRDFAALRADGERIEVGENVFFGERATVHIADGARPARIGRDSTIGRFGLVHACTLAEGVVVGEGASVLDGAEIGPYAVIAADGLVPPRKILEGAWLHAGSPAAPVRPITPAECREIAQATRAGFPPVLVAASALPPLSHDAFVPEAEGAGPLHALDGITPRIARAFVAPTAAVAGDIDVQDDASVFFGCALVAGGARIVVGRGTNVQDNSLLTTDRARGDLVIGDGVTIGHNARIGSAEIGDGALIGMGSRLGDAVVVEAGGCVAAGAWVDAGARVESGWIWAGRPARPFRELRPEERQAFARFRDVYVGYGAVYRADPRDPG